MKTCIIYKCTSPSGKVYIGQTNRTLQQRWKEHINAARTGSNLPLSRAIRRHSKEAFTVEIIVEKVPIYMVNAFEKYWIHFFDSLHKGYNCTEGGKGVKGYVTSDTTKKLLALRSKGNTSALGNKHTNKVKQQLSMLHKGNLYWKGKVHSIESKVKMSVSAKGRVVSLSTREKLSIAATGRYHTEDAKSKMSTHAKLNRVGKNHSRATQVICVETNEIFDTIQDAAKSKNIDNSAIGKCCKGILKSTGGYRWQYKDNQ